MGIFLYIAQVFEHVLAVAFGSKLFWIESHDRHMFYIAHTAKRILPVAFRNKLFGFESHYRHISLCISTLNDGNRRAWWLDGCAFVAECFCSYLVSGVSWGNEMRDCWKLCSSNFSFRSSSNFFLSCCF